MKKPKSALKRISLLLALSALAAFTGCGTAKPVPAHGPVYTVCCAGDSLTFGYAARNPAAQSYPAVLATRTDRGLRFLTENCGCSGACVDRDASLPYASTSEYAASMKTEAEIVLLMLGTNDAFRSFDGAFEESFTSLLQGYMALPQAPLVAVVLPPHVFLASARTDCDARLEELVSKEKAAAEALGLPVIDARSFTEAAESLFIDGVHFTEEGYAALADVVYTRLCDILGS